MELIPYMGLRVLLQKQIIIPNFAKISKCVGVSDEMSGHLCVSVYSLIYVK